MKRFLIIVIIILRFHSLIAQIDREEIVSAVKEAIEESDNSRRRVRYTTLSNESRKIAEQELEEARKAVEARIKRDKEAYEERQKYRTINYLLHNTEPWWMSAQEEVNNAHNSESSSIESTEKTELNRNMEYLLYISASLFVICIGSITMQRVKNPDAAIEFTLSGKLILSLIPMIAFVFLVITVSKIVNLKWYWSILVSFITYLFTWRFLTRNYCLFFGIKTKPFFSFTEGKIIRANVHLEDAILTLVVGVVMLLIAY